jgi:thymidylate kinase
MERKERAFHAEVCEAYRRYARGAKEPVRVIDAGRDEASVFADVMRAVEPEIAAS